MKGNFKRNPNNDYLVLLDAKSNTLWMFLVLCLHWETDCQGINLHFLTTTAMFPCYKNSITLCCVVCIPIALRYHSAITAHCSQRCSGFSSTDFKWVRGTKLLVSFADACWFEEDRAVRLWCSRW